MVKLKMPILIYVQILFCIIKRNIGNGKDSNGETLLETLLLSPILDFSNAEVLLDAFGENYMTAKLLKT